MRYYDITLTPPPGATPTAATPAVLENQQKAQLSQLRWTTHPNGPTGIFDPTALQVEFELAVTREATIYGNPGTVTIYGVPLGLLQQAQNLAGYGFTLKGGMGKGLPLANPTQAGVLVAGSIYAAMGNWVGTEMSLTLLVQASKYTYKDPGNITFHWPAKTSLASALQSCLSIAYPGVNVSIDISPRLVLPNTELHICQTLGQLAQYIETLTQAILAPSDPTYPGVAIVWRAGTIFVYDGVGTIHQLVFSDLIGQPTWTFANELTVMTVMRADIQVGDLILMPQGTTGQPGVVTTTSQSVFPGDKNKSAFSGYFHVTAVRHIGHSRSPDGRAWSSTFVCVPIIPPAAGDSQ